MEDGGVMLAALHALDIQLGADPVLSPVLICVISPEVSRAPLKRLLYGAQITEEETEAQSSDVACPRPAHSQEAMELGFKARSLLSKPRVRVPDWLSL